MYLIINWVLDKCGFDGVMRLNWGGGVSKMITIHCERNMQIRFHCNSPKKLKLLNEFWVLYHLIYHLGTMNVCTKDCADPCGRCGKFGGKSQGNPKRHYDLSSASWITVPHFFSLIVVEVKWIKVVDWPTDRQHGHSGVRYTFMQRISWFNYRLWTITQLPLNYVVSNKHRSQVNL